MSKGKWTSLQTDLDQLAREDPDVAASAKALDDHSRDMQAEFRRRAYELVERELREAGATDVRVDANGAPTVCVFGGHQDVRWEYAKSLLAAVDMLERTPARCECGATLAHYTGAGASGVLCPVCDSEFADELEPGEQP